MAETAASLAEQFDDMPQQREASMLGMWTFLATEILFFGAMFLCYTVYRHAYPFAFAEASRHTITFFGTLNTGVLLTSSLTMALAVHSAQQNDQKSLVRFLLVTVILGCCFLAIKALEYRADFAEHLWPGPNFRAGLPAQARIFWFLYWIMTGVHALHVTIGVGLLSVIAWLAARGKYSDYYYNPVEISGLYWHFVDIVWIFLYPLLYLISRFS
jgi:cytochrome c oxidase subunit 3